MQLKQRIKKLERRAGVNDNYCKCGTPYLITFVIGGENLNKNICPDCGRDIKPPTKDNFQISFSECEYRVIEPRVEFTREEFEEYQNGHVMTEHISYEQFLAQQQQNSL